MASESVPGSCLCEAVRFEIELPTSVCGHCHCSVCRRNHGASYVTWIGVPRTQLRMLAGEEVLTRFASSPHGVRSFCSRCGTSIFCELDHDPDTIDIPLAIMDGEIDRAPQAHIYFDDRASWVAVGDALPRLGGETGMQPIDAEDA